MGVVAVVGTIVMLQPAGGPLALVLAGSSVVAVVLALRLPPSAVRRLRAAYRAGDDELVVGLENEAMRAMGSRHQMEPWRATTALMVAEALARLDRFDQATTRLEQVIALTLRTDQRGRALVLLTLAASNLGRYDDARRHGRDLLEHRPARRAYRGSRRDAATVLLFLAEVERRTSGDDGPLVAQVIELIGRAPLDREATAQVLYGLAEHALDHRDPERARSFLDRADAVPVATTATRQGRSRVPFVVLFRLEVDRLLDPTVDPGPALTRAWSAIGDEDRSPRWYCQRVTAFLALQDGDVAGARRGFDAVVQTYRDRGRPARAAALAHRIACDLDDAGAATEADLLEAIEVSAAFGHRSLEADLLARLSAH